MGFKGRRGKELPRHRCQKKETELAAGDCWTGSCLSMVEVELSAEDTVHFYDGVWLTASAISPYIWCQVPLSL